MTVDKQILLLDYIISCPDIFARTQAILDSKYFDPELRRTVAFITHYYGEYSKVPTPEQISAETGINLTARSISPDQIEYSLDEIEKFCKDRAIKIALAECIELLKTEDYGTIRQKIIDASIVSLNRNRGLNYFEDPEGRLTRLLVDLDITPTGWQELDYHLEGGIARKEMLLFAANSGGGKSVSLLNLAYNFLIRKKNVLYITLELSEDVVSLRFDQMLTGFGRSKWKNHVDSTVSVVKSLGDRTGSLKITWMRSGSRPLDIRAYLKTYYLEFSKMPDLLIVDYIDKMSPNEKVRSDDVWGKDKACAEQLRDIAVEEDMCLATASQLNREAVRAIAHDHAHIAGGISKINETDVFVSILLNEDTNQCIYSLLKTRNSGGVGEHVVLRWDPVHIRILDPSDLNLERLKNKASINKNNKYKGDERNRNTNKHEDDDLNLGSDDDLLNI